MPRRKPTLPAPAARHTRLAVESLEDRSVPAAFTVNTTLDTVDASPGDGFARDAAGNTSLRAAVMEANALSGADTIELPAGTFAFTRTGNLEDAAGTGDLDILDSLTITGVGQASTIIDARSLDRVFHIIGVFRQGGPTVSISNLTVTGGQAPNVTGSTGNGGGGILNEFSTLALDRVTVRGNKSGSGSFGGDGGGIYTVVGTTTIDNSTITQNQTGIGTTAVGGDGGGVASLTSTTTIRDSVISNNRTGDGASGTINAGDGGGIASQSAERDLNGFLKVIRTTVSGNTVGTNGRGEGGGIITHDERFVLEDSTVSGNTAWRAGGIYLSIARSSDISGSTISGNTATAGGAGGIYVQTSSSNLISGTTISGTTISGNGAPNSNQFDGGGGIINQGRIAKIVNTTISGNTTSAVGGGIANYNTIDSMVNVTIAGNTASDGGGLYHMLFANFTPVITDLRNTLIADNAATTTTAKGADFVQLGSVTTAVNNLVETSAGHSLTNGTNGNVVGSDPKLGSLASNGGLTRTQAISVGSPALNAGTATGAPDADQRGLARPSGNGVDIGAFEAQYPVAKDDSYSTDEDVKLTVAAPGVQGNDSGPAGATLTVKVATGPAHGALTLNANGSFTYTPARNFNGTDGFTYTLSDGSLESAGSVTITVKPVNDAPFPSPIVQELTTPEDTPLSGQVKGIDVDGDALAFSLEVGPEHGELTFNSDGTYAYTPDADYSGDDAFVFRVSDPSKASNLGGVSITVTPVNDDPAAKGDSYEVDEDGTLTVAADAVTRLRMVSEPGDYIGQGLTYDFTPSTATFDADKNYNNGVSLDVDPPALGEFWFLDFAAADKATLATGTYLDAMRFAFPDPGHPGLDVSGNGRGSNELTGQFTVYDVAFSGDAVTRFAAAFEQHSEGNDPALVGWVMFNSTFGAGGGVLANDTDVEGDLLLGATLVSGPAHGKLTFNGDGTFTYAPDADFNGTDSFTYRTSDGRLDSNEATVTITVKPVSDAPVAEDDSATTDEDNAVTINVLGNDADADGDDLAVTLVSKPAHGEVQQNDDGSFTYTPDANFNGTESFTYQVSDGTLDSAVATVSITVKSVNDAPAAADDSVTTDEDAAVTVKVLANDSDADGDSLSVTLVSGPAHGSVVLDGDGTFTYTPAGNFNGSDSFTYKVSDGALESGVVAVSVAVKSVNDAPVARNDSYTTEAGAELAVAGPGVLANDADVDGDSLAAELVSGPAHGALLLNADGSFVYLPDDGYSGTDSFTYRAVDGTLSSDATVTIQVNAVATSVPSARVSGKGRTGAGAFTVSVRSRESAGGTVLEGTVVFTDQARGISLWSTSITGLRFESDSTRAQITGTAMVNGTSGYTFTAYVSDRDSGRKDAFQIVISGPDGFLYASADYDADGVLDSGNLQLHLSKKKK